MVLIFTPGRLNRSVFSLRIGKFRSLRQFPDPAPLVQTEGAQGTARRSVEMVTKPVFQFPLNEVHFATVPEVAREAAGWRPVPVPAASLFNPEP
jgi:hypothetical protein